MGHWIYENWQAGPHKAILHVGSCAFCNEGRGLSGQGTHPAHGRWIGPFASLDDAKARANALRPQEIKVHSCC